MTHIHQYSAKLIVLSAMIVLVSETSDASTITTTLVPLLNDSTESVTAFNDTATDITTKVSPAAAAADDEDPLDTTSVISNDNGLIEVTMSNNHRPPRGSIVVSNEINKSVQQVSSLTRSVKRDTIDTSTTVTAIDDVTATTTVTTDTLSTIDTTATTIDDTSTMTTDTTRSTSLTTDTVTETVTDKSMNDVSDVDLSTSTPPPLTVRDSSVTTIVNNEVEGDPVTTDASTTIDTLIDDAKCFNSTKQWQLNILRRIQVTLDNVNFQLDSTLGPEGATRRDLLRRALTNLMTLQSRVMSRDPETSEEESQVGLLMNAEGRLNRIGWVVYRNRKDWDFNDCCYQGLNFMCGSRKKSPSFDPR